MEGAVDIVPMESTNTMQMIIIVSRVALARMVEDVHIALLIYINTELAKINVDGVAQLQSVVGVHLAQQENTKNNQQLL